MTCRDLLKLAFFVVWQERGRHDISAKGFLETAQLLIFDLCLDGLDVFPQFDL